MPIRPENKNRYPKDWPEISRRIRARADQKCEQCGVDNYAFGGRDDYGNFHKAIPKGESCLRIEWPKAGEFWWCEGVNVKLRIIKIILTVAHLDHMPENCSDENLKALCQRCHNLYDAKMRRIGIKHRRRQLQSSGDLFDE